MSDLSPPPPQPPPAAPGRYRGDAVQAGAGGGYQRIGGLATAAQMLTWCVLAATALSVIIIAARHGTFVDYLNGDASRRELDRAAGAIGLTSALAGGLQLALVVVTMVWMFRVARNNQSLGRAGATWSPGWAIAGWFCPPCIFVIPWLHLGELWRGTDPGSPAGDPNWKRNRISPLIAWWWVFFGLGSILLAVTRIRVQRAGTEVRGDLARNYRDGVPASLASLAVTVVAGVLWVTIVRRMTARQRTLTGGG
jgi:hypothetical protein